MFERTREFISCVWIFRGNREAAAVLTTEGFLCANRSQVRLTESFLITVQPPLSTLGSAQRDGLHTCLWDPQNITPTLSGDIRLSVMYGRQPERRVSSRSSRRPRAASHRARRGAAEHTHTASFSQFSFWCLWSAGKTDEIFRWSCCLFIPAQRYSDIADRFASHLWGGVRLSLSYVSGNFCRLLSAVCHMQIWSLSFTLQGSNQGDRFVSSEGGSVDPAGRHVYSSEKVEEGAVRWIRGCAVDGGREVKKERRKHFVV